MPDETKEKPAPNVPAEKPVSSAVPASAKPAPPAHAAPPKPAGPAPVPWESEMISDLRRLYGSGILEASVYLGQKYIVIDRSVAFDLLRRLRDDGQFDYLVDVTAVHYPQREQQFDLVWVLYSFADNERIRVKTLLPETESAPSVVSLWPAANWLEREVFDMFGIRFEGHPDLKRILLPEDWKGYPLRKDYGILQQDQEWVRSNLGIESGQ